MAAEGSSEATRDSDGAPEDDTKRKFKEALERKKAKAAEGSAHKEGGSKGPKAQGHGPVENRREFRRKSG